MDAFPLVVFLIAIVVVIVLVILEPRVPVPESLRRTSSFYAWLSRRTLDYSLVPCVAAFFLLITGSISFEDVWNGIKGDKYVKPYAIIILFQSLAYLCISLDLTGVFAYLALRITAAADKSGWKLFIYYFVLSSVMTIFTSNDIVILTLTPIIVYCTTSTNTNPMPYLFGEFMAANIWSVILMVGNPTNIIAADANGLNFVSYTKWMGLPAIVAGFTCLAVLVSVFYTDIPSSFHAPTIDARSTLINPFDAVFGSVVLALTLLTLSVCSFIGVPMWTMCLLAAMIVLSRNIYLFCYTKQVIYKVDPIKAAARKSDANRVSLENARGSLGALQLSDLPIEVPATPSQPVLPAPTSASSAPSTPAVSSPAAGPVQNSVVLAVPSPQTQAQTPAQTTSHATVLPISPADAANGDLALLNNTAARSTDDTIKGAELGERLTVFTALAAMPWNVVPFVFGMFILVEALSVSGWIEWLARQLADTIGDSSAASVFLLALVSVLSCNLINNQPMTILFTRVLLHDSFKSRVQGRARDGALYSLILGSNLGGDLTVIGALAGIMWVKLLRGKGISLSPLTFSYYGALVVVPATALAAFVIWIELKLF